MAFDSLEQMVATTFDAVSPLEQLNVVEAAKKYVFIRQPGSYVGFWSEKKAPYIVEPQEIMTSLDYTGMIFVGPARTLKSQMGLNWIAQTAKTDPSDMMVVHMTQHTGRDWSKRELDKMFRNSAELRKLLAPGRQNDNTFDKAFLSGMKLLVTWPTANNLSGKTIRRSILMDYDRMDDDIDGEGNAFDLTDKRGETFGRHRMTVAESSPNPDKEITDPKWRGRTPHEAPPIKGIFELYNRGDRRRWYWRCPSCRHSFEPSFKLLNYPKSADMMEAAEMVTLKCPQHACGFDMVPEQKEELNQGGRWVRDGMIWLPEGDVVQMNGQRIIRSDIASFWVKGPAAAFQTWDKLVLNYLRGEQAYEDTGDETLLKKTVTTDQGDYYIPKARLSERAPEDLKNKAEDWGSTQDDPTVPKGVRFLEATVDVQARSFVVQVQGFTADGDMIVIDGFKIERSSRKNADGEREIINPAAYAEDWDEITEHVIRKSYPLDDATGRRMSIRATGCDSAGREGFTVNAYAWWRRLRDGGEGLHRRVILVKGDGKPTAPRTAVTWPDQQHKDKNSPVRGDVPVLRLNSNALKDQLNGLLERRVSDEESGGGMIRYPDWMPEWFYNQLTTEIRTPKGWVNPHTRRNEAFDLSYYALAIAVRPPDIATNAPWVVIRWDRIDWDNPPSWAAEWDDNDLVFEGKEQPRFIAPAKPRKSFADLAKDLA